MESGGTFLKEGFPRTPSKNFCGKCRFGGAETAFPGSFREEGHGEKAPFSKGVSPRHFLYQYDIQ